MTVELPGPRVLVVEDECLIREMLVEALIEQGFEVAAVACGEDALRQIAQGFPCDVLFTDVNLGRGIDGVALSWSARKLRPALPVVYASGSVGGLRQLHAVPGASFLRQPYDPKLLGALLHAAACAPALTPA
jgi:CheY-like chemotaxis protein